RRNTNAILFQKVTANVAARSLLNASPRGGNHNVACNTVNDTWGTIRLNIEAVIEERSGAAGNGFAPSVVIGYIVLSDQLSNVFEVITGRESIGAVGIAVG